MHDVKTRTPPLIGRRQVSRFNLRGKMGVETGELLGNNNVASLCYKLSSERLRFPTQFPCNKL
jgi:hypothetical protein